MEIIPITHTVPVLRGVQWSMVTKCERNSGKLLLGVWCPTSFTYSCYFHLMCTRALVPQNFQVTAFVNSLSFYCVIALALLGNGIAKLKEYAELFLDEK